jgi:hypothetical protein
VAGFGESHGVLQVSREADARSGSHPAPDAGVVQRRFGNGIPAHFALRDHAVDVRMHVFHRISMVTMWP